MAVNPEDSHRRCFLNHFGTLSVAGQINADIYHLHDLGFLPCWALLSMTTDTNIVYDIHEGYEHDFQSCEFPSDWLNPLFGRTFPNRECTLAAPSDAIILLTNPRSRSSATGVTIEWLRSRTTQSWISSR